MTILRSGAASLLRPLCSCSSGSGSGSSSSLRIAATAQVSPSLWPSSPFRHRTRSASVLNNSAGVYAHHQRLSSTPRWSDESIAAVKGKYEAKYEERLRAKAREKGFGSIDELKSNARQEGRMKPTVQDLLARKRAKTAGAADKATGEAGAGDVDPATATGPGTGTAPIKGTAPPPSADASSSLATADAAAARQMSKRSEKSPVKPLNDIVDLSKLVSQSPEGIAAIWNGFHQLAGNERALSAVIPYDIYRKMQERARKYSSFVVPVPREIQTAPAAGSAGAAAEGTKQTGHEMHFLQWSFLPSAPESGCPPISTVLFTPLGLYQAQQTYAQPHLILTHYTDLVPSHGIVLMKGDLTPDTPATPADGQLLTLRLQQFYTGQSEEREQLLKTFHEQPDKFDVQALVDSVGAL